jgi:glycerol transport system ATP-binding protein
MARIELVNLAHSYKAHPTSPSDYALLPMTMTWDDGGAYALLGPSGCGKTTLAIQYGNLFKEENYKNEQYNTKKYRSG